MKKLTARMRGEGLGARFMRGTLMTMGGFGGQNAIRLAGNLVLTRLLFPEAFGLMALVQLVMFGLTMFSDLGIQASIIQDKKGVDPRFLDTAWAIQIARGVVLWLATWLLAMPIANFYDAPLLADLLPVAGLTALFQGFNSTRIATASREIRLGRLTLLQLGAQLAGLLVMIALAYHTRSVWALVIGGLVTPALIAGLSHVVLPGHRNRLRFDKEAAQSLIGFGKYIFLASLAGFLIAQADRAILGRLVSLETLALYNIAFFLATVPLMLTRKLINTVLFPLYAARPPGESAANLRDVARARLLIALAMVALSAVLAIVGNALVVFLYDPRYEAAGPLMVLIALAQLPEIVVSSYNAVLLARGASGRFAALQISSALMKTGLILVGALWFGVIGVVVAPFVATLLFYPLQVWFIRPFGGWMPRQDAIFAAVLLVFSAFVLWLNMDVVTQAIEIFGLR